MAGVPRHRESLTGGTNRVTRHAWTNVSWTIRRRRRQMLVHCCIYRYDENVIDDRTWNRTGSATRSAAEVRLADRVLRPRISATGRVPVDSTCPPIAT